MYCSRCRLGLSRRGAADTCISCHPMSVSPPRTPSLPYLKRNQDHGTKNRPSDDRIYFYVIHPGAHLEPLEPTASSTIMYTVSSGWCQSYAAFRQPCVYEPLVGTLYTRLIPSDSNGTWKTLKLCFSKRRYLTPYATQKILGNVGLKRKVGRYAGRYMILHRCPRSAPLFVGVVYFPFSLFCSPMCRSFSGFQVPVCEVKSVIGSVVVGVEEKETYPRSRA
jgi:hypothetical protein